MTAAAAAVFKISTESPQLASPQPDRGKGARPAARAKAGRPAPTRSLANGTGRAATRGGGEVIELEYGITVYPAREEHGRWCRRLPGPTSTSSGMPEAFRRPMDDHPPRHVTTGALSVIWISRSWPQRGQVPHTCAEATPSVSKASTCS